MQGVLARVQAPLQVHHASPAVSQPTRVSIVTFPNSKRPRRWLKAQPGDEDYVSYEGDKSVFPAEASEEIGTPTEGFGKEVKPKPTPPTPTPTAQQPDREYIDYQEKKTVFPGEACDELGGEFCEPEYQQDVFPDKVASK